MCTQDANCRNIRSEYNLYWNREKNRLAALSKKLATLKGCRVRLSVHYKVICVGVLGFGIPTLSLRHTMAGRICRHSHQFRDLHGAFCIEAALTCS
jgi:hypothetical protein